MRLLTTLIGLAVFGHPISTAAQTASQSDSEYDLGVKADLCIQATCQSFTECKRLLVQDLARRLPPKLTNGSSGLRRPLR